MNGPMAGIYVFLCVFIIGQNKRKRKNRKHKKKLKEDRPFTVPMPCLEASHGWFTKKMTAGKPYGGTLFVFSFLGEKPCQLLFLYRHGILM